MYTVLLIVNPISGKKIAKKILPTVVSEFEKNQFQIKIIESEYKGHIESILNTYSIEDYYCCCIIGGDGSFHEAVNGLMKRLDNVKVPLCLFQPSLDPQVPQKTECLDRSIVWLMETPQAARKDWLEDGLRKAENKGVGVTDELSAIELTERKAAFLDPGYPNPKITRESDLAYIEFLLKT